MVFRQEKNGMLRFCLEISFSKMSLLLFCLTVGDVPLLTL